MLVRVVQVPVRLLLATGLQTKTTNGDIHRFRGSRATTGTCLAEHGDMSISLDYMSFPTARAGNDRHSRELRRHLYRRRLPSQTPVTTAGSMRSGSSVVLSYRDSSTESSNHLHGLTSVTRMSYMARAYLYMCFRPVHHWSYLLLLQVALLGHTCPCYG